jgi:hypothetical protein
MVGRMDGRAYVGRAVGRFARRWVGYAVGREAGKAVGWRIVKIVQVVGSGSKCQVVSEATPLT